MLKCLAGSGPGCLLLRRALRREASLCYVTSHTVLIMAVSEQLPEVHPAMPRTSATCCFFPQRTTPALLWCPLPPAFLRQVPAAQRVKVKLKCGRKKKNQTQITARVGYLADFLKGKSRALCNYPVKM